jgi:hypothetical protein
LKIRFYQPTFQANLTGQAKSPKFQPKVEDFLSNTHHIARLITSYDDSDYFHFLYYYRRSFFSMAGSIDPIQTGKNKSRQILEPIPELETEAKQFGDNKDP